MDVMLIDQKGQLNVFWAVAGGAWQGPAKLGLAGLTNSGANVSRAQQLLDTPAELTFAYSPIVFPSGTAVGGWAQAVLWQDATLTFTGHYHDSEALEYNVSAAIVVKDDQSRVYTIEHTNTLLEFLKQARAKKIGWSIRRTTRLQQIGNQLWRHISLLLGPVGLLTEVLRSMASLLLAT